MLLVLYHTLHVGIPCYVAASGTFRGSRRSVYRAVGSPFDKSRMSLWSELCTRGASSPPAPSPPSFGLQVHEIEPGYSREDFALPGRVGFITEVCGVFCRFGTPRRYPLFVRTSWATGRQRERQVYHLYQYLVCTRMPRQCTCNVVC